MRPNSYPQPASRAALTIQEICNEISTRLHQQASEACNKLMVHLTRHRNSIAVYPTLLELSQHIIYKLNHEIRHCINKETNDLFPLFMHPFEMPPIQNILQEYIDTHQLVLQYTSKLKKLLASYMQRPVPDLAFAAFLQEVNNLDSAVFKWISVEDDLLFPKVIGLVERTKYIQTVFR